MLGTQTSMLTHEELAYQKVARLVVRQFYDVEETLVMEVLLQAPRRAGKPNVKTGAVVYHPTMQLDEVVAERLNLGTKQVRRHLSRLFQDRLVVKTRGGTDKDAKKNAPGYDPKAVEGFAAGELNASDVRFFWGIDYEVLVDAVHFKLDAMKRALDDKHKRANAGQQCRCGLDSGLARSSSHPAIQKPARLLRSAFEPGEASPHRVGARERLWRHSSACTQSPISLPLSI